MFPVFTKLFLFFFLRSAEPRQSALFLALDHIFGNKEIVRRYRWFRSHRDPVLDAIGLCFKNALFDII